MPALRCEPLPPGPPFRGRVGTIPGGGIDQQHGAHQLGVPRREGLRHATAHGAARDDGVTPPEFSHQVGDIVAEPLDIVGTGRLVAPAMATAVHRDDIRILQPPDNPIPDTGVERQ